MLVLEELDFGMECIYDQIGAMEKDVSQNQWFTS